MPFSKQKAKDGLENSSNIKQVHEWFPNSDRIVFEPKGHDDKQFSVKIETVNSIQGMGWQIHTFYDGFVEIEKRNQVLAEKKLKEIKEIID